jgi:DNA-binding LacI/PurR family transcriptional regulator
LDQGHKRLAYINRQIAYGGDQLTIEGVFSALHARGHGLDSVTLRFLPPANEVYGAEARRLLMQPQGPTGFICRTVRMADEVAAAAKSLGLGKNVAVAVCDYYQRPNEQPRYAWAKPLLSSEEIGRRLAQLLIRQSQGRESVSGIEVVPVELEVPTAMNGTPQ